MTESDSDHRAGVDAAIRGTGRRPIRTSAAARSSDATAVTAVVALPEHDRRRSAPAVPGAAVGLSARGAPRAELGGELLGFYHSHPDHPARPSQYDLDHAWPTFAYIIVAVAAGSAARHDRVVSQRRSIDASKRAVLNMAKILIPTPLRPYTDKQDAVDAAGATVGELLADLTTQARRPQGASLQRTGQAAQLRQHLRQRRGHPLSAERADAGEAGRHGQHHPVGRRRRDDRRRRGPPQPT